MKTVFAVKMIELDDILKFSGKVSMCNTLKDMEKDNNPNILDYITSNEVVTIDTSREGNFPIFNMLNAYLLKFIPVDLIEERMYIESIKYTIHQTKSSVITVKRKDQMDDLCNELDDRYDKLKSEFTEEKILNSSCYMFVYDESNKLIDISITTPTTVIDNVLLKPNTYICCECGKVHNSTARSLETLLPNMYYNIEDENVRYYCEKCAEGKNLKHVGQ